MKLNQLVLLVITPALMLIDCQITDIYWFAEKHPGYTLIYTSNDNQNIKVYNTLISNGIATVEAFFNSSFNNEFEVYIHPDRQSLDSTWQKEWNMPDFKSECWMVASGVANRMDIISPAHWDKEACEHIYSDTLKTQQLIIHELVHVYHGQKNVSPDFSNTEGIDWFVEGLATYASGQCDSLRLSEVKNAIKDNKIPDNLDDFWSGKIKYGLSGSVVMFLDHKYGRAILNKLLILNNKTEILAMLKTTEAELLEGWEKYVQCRFRVYCK